MNVIPSYISEHIYTSQWISHVVSLFVISEVPFMFVKGRDCSARVTPANKLGHQHFSIKTGLLTK